MHILVVAAKDIHKEALCSNKKNCWSARFWGNKGYHGDLLHPLFNVVALYYRTNTLLLRKGGNLLKKKRIY